MIDWISDWLRELVLMIMVAIFLDLILPNNSMQRYVKVVVSLFIVLVMLNPILAIFQLNIDSETWLAPYLNSSDSRNTEDILQQGELLKKKHEAQSIDLVGDQIEQLIKDELASQFSVQAHDIQLFIQQKGDGYNLEEIQVVVEPMDVEEQGEMKHDTVYNPVEPVKPVIIQVVPGDSGNEITEDQQTEGIPISQQSENQEALQNQIQTWIAQRLELKVQQVNVTFVDS